MCNDTKLNISTTYLKPGFAFGVRACQGFARSELSRFSLDLKLPLLDRSSTQRRTPWTQHSQGA